MCMCEYTLRALITHEWRILIIPVDDVVIIQHHNVTLAVTTLNTTTAHILYELQIFSKIVIKTKLPCVQMLLQLVYREDATI